MLPAIDTWTTVLSRTLEAPSAHGSSQRKLLLVGHAGCGKTLLAKRLGDLLPPLTPELAEGLASWFPQYQFEPGAPAPFRAPHHTCSLAGMVGSRSLKRAGEVTLATGGTLFLDELPEFRSSAVAALLEVLTRGYIRLTSSLEDNDVWSLTLPARPTFVIAAMNTCPCGLLGCSRKTNGRVCQCSQDTLTAYYARCASWLPFFDQHVYL